MAELKTKKTAVTPQSFLKTVKEEEKRKDSFAILELMKKATKSEGKMWGGSIIGFGDYILEYPNGRKLDWFMMGFSPRKQNFALYCGATADENKDLLKKLGKHETGKGCLYIKKVSDVDTKVLSKILENQVKKCKAK